MNVVQGVFDRLGHQRAGFLPGRRSRLRAGKCLLSCRAAQGNSPHAKGHHAGVGHALMSQLLANLEALCVASVRTEVDWRLFQLNRFLADCGFVPAQRVALTLEVAGDESQ